MIMIYSTFPDKETAKNTIKKLIKNKIVACANIFSIESIYTWQNKLQNDSEFVVVFKTKSEKWNLAQEEIKKLHPYEVPCIIKIDAKANNEFESWLNKLC